MKGHLLLFIALWLFWSMLTGFDYEEIVIGAAVSLIISSIAHYSFTHGKRTGYIKALLGIVAFIPYYIHAEIVAHLRVIKMILTGKINSGFVEIKNHHTNEWGTTALANAITMTPGTLTVLADDEKLLVHCLDRGMKKKDIAEGFDHYLRKIWV